MITRELIRLPGDASATGLWYLASPYSHKDRFVRVWRFRAAARVAGWLRRTRGITTFSPISHSHPISEEMRGKPPSFDFWLGWDKVIIDKCDGAIVCQLPGWRQSSGIEKELVWFDERGLSIYGYDPSHLFTATELNQLEDQ